MAQVEDEDNVKKRDRPESQKKSQGHPAVLNLAPAARGIGGMNAHFHPSSSCIRGHPAWTKKTPCAALSALAQCALTPRRPSRPAKRQPDQPWGPTPSQAVLSVCLSNSLAPKNHDCAIGLVPPANERPMRCRRRSRGEAQRSYLEASLVT